MIEMFNWLTVLSGSSGVSENNDYDIWLTSCTEGASDISKTNNWDIWLINCTE
jgi:hypothetical protein